MASAKIFRINYKSDFILTLESDAGWMTPFCIKFWTGAPSQAYYVGWDGETYNHCSFDPSEPTKLQVQFDDHHLPIGDLKYQVAYHFTVADFPNDTEDEVINPASITTEIDGETYQVMLDFTGETAPEIQFALPAYANEAQRIANEQQRIAAETQRIDNEETRIANEQTRINQEQTRQQNEQQRINQEQARVQEYAQLKADAVAATGAANDAATLANQKAQLAADKAALAQDAANLANAKAQLAADKAALAASAAQLANDKAALAQQKAEYAQTQGGYAKDQGDYAKDQGDYAKAKGDYAKEQGDYAKDQGDYAKDKGDICAEDHQTAVADHQTAVADHQTAQSDHTTAGNDHTTAQSDHTIASNDHTQAGNDHTRAESDHTRAESDHAAVEVYVDSLGAFDISAYHATGGVLAKYADLTAALGTNGANIPEGIRKGGMSVKFVLTSDNKYVQYALKSQTFSTTLSDWQIIESFSKGIFGTDIVFSDANNYNRTGSIFIGSAVTSTTCANLPKYGSPCIFEVYSEPVSTTMFLLQRASYADGTVYCRILSTQNSTISVLSDWKEYVFDPSKVFKQNGVITSSINNINNYKTEGTLFIGSGVTQQSCANLPKYGKAGILSVSCENVSGTLIVIQQISYVDGDIYQRMLSDNNGNVSILYDWRKTNITDVELYEDLGIFTQLDPAITDIDNYLKSGTLFIGSGVTQEQCANLPLYGKAAVLTNFRASFTLNNTKFIDCKQVIKYVNGPEFSRIVYGTDGDWSKTAWEKTKTTTGFKTVKTDGSGDYTTVTAAISAANNGDTIIIYPGTYDGTLRLWTKLVNLIGIDKETCIIRATDGRYANPAMEATTGHFENLTFISQYVSGTSQEIGTDPGAYAVHCEGAQDGGFAIGKKLSFKNCKLISDFSPAFGCGASANWELYLEDCELICNQPSTRGVYVNDGGLGALFFHDQGGTTKGHCDVTIKRCTIQTTVLENSMCIYDLNEAGNSVNMEFIGNTIYSATLGFVDSIWWRGITTPFGNHIALSPLSNSNTLQSVNAVH